MAAHVAPSASTTPAGEFDLIVVGGGPGGYVAAIRAAQLGLKVACVEREHLGGICANWGCIPTKALLHTAETFLALKKGAHLGIHCDGLRFNYGEAIAHSRRIADGQQRGVGLLFKKNKIEHIKQSAVVKRSAAGVSLQLGDREVRAKHILLATGAKPKNIPTLTPDGKDILTYFEAMNLPAQPASLCIVGAGAIGVEFAYFYNAIGTKVILLEALPQILPIEDKEIAQQLQRSLTSQGIAIQTGAKFQSVEKTTAGLKVRFTDASGQAREEVVEKVLSAVGVRGNIDSLGVEAAGIKVERGFISVDEWYQVRDNDGRTIPGLYAIGDVIGGALLAHKASAEGIACIEKLAGLPQTAIRRVDYSTMPGATFCRPEVGSMGLTEDKAREKGLDVQIGKFPFKVSGKAQATGETEGMCKVVLDRRTGEILGAHILGGTASDMIATLTLARSAELTVTEVLHTVFAHPTYAEIMKGSIEAALGEAIDL